MRERKTDSPQKKGHTGDVKQVYNYIMENKEQPGEHPRLFLFAEKEGEGYKKKKKGYAEYVCRKNV